MPIKEQTQKVVKTFTTFWESQDKKRKILYIALIVCIILAAIIITAILNKKDYVVLYEGLDSTQAATMVSLIEDMGYEAKLSKGTITVLKGTENKIIIGLAQQEYPKSGLGYPNFLNKSGMFSTEAELDAYYKMDMENRLASIISDMENIESATVTLTSPKQKNTVIPTFREYPTAAVTVHLIGIEKLSNKQIKGITNIVKMGWSGLTDENISIVDSYGIPQIADANGDYDFIVEETKRLAFKTNLENSIKEKILELLMPVYGDDGVSVAVNMLLDFDKKVSENTNYSADGNGNTGVLQHADANNASGGTTAAGGVMGLEGNADDTYPTGNTNGTGAWTEESISNTYLVDTYKEQVEKAGYDVEGISISVIVYKDYLSEAEKLDLVRLVGNAGTVNPLVLEDVVTVSNYARYDAAPESDDTKPKIFLGLTFDQLVLVGAILIILIIVLLVVMAILSGSAKKKRKAFEKQIIENAGLAVSEDDMPVDTFTFAEAGEPVAVPSLTDEQIETKEVVIRREIGEFAKASPEIVAQLLKNWMKDEEDA